MSASGGKADIDQALLTILSADFFGGGAIVPATPPQIFSVAADSPGVASFTDDLGWVNTVTPKKWRPISLENDWTPKALSRECREGKTGTKLTTSSARRGAYRCEMRPLV